MLDITEIVHINQRLAYVYITIIGQLNSNTPGKTLACRFNHVNQTK